MDRTALMKELQCQVCLQTLKDPVVLPACGHSLCAKCLNDFVQKQSSQWIVVNCPTGCSKVSTISKAAGLPKAYQFAALIEALEKFAKPAATIDCRGCGSKMAAEKVLKCHTCRDAIGEDVLLCADCAFDGHRHHDVIRLHSKPTSAEVLSKIDPQDLDLVALREVGKYEWVVESKAAGDDEEAIAYEGKDYDKAVAKLCDILQCSSTKVLYLGILSAGNCHCAWPRLMGSLRRSPVDSILFIGTDFCSLELHDFARLLDAKATSHMSFESCRFPSLSFMRLLKMDSDNESLLVSEYCCKVLCK